MTNREDWAPSGRSSPAWRSLIMARSARARPRDSSATRRHSGRRWRPSRCAFSGAELDDRLDAAREALAAFVAPIPTTSAFIANATSGVNAVLRSLTFSTATRCSTDHCYAACRTRWTTSPAAAGRASTSLSSRSPSPPRTQSWTLFSKVTPRTRLALLDHITSPPGSSCPSSAWSRGLARRGIETLCGASPTRPGWYRSTSARSARPTNSANATMDLRAEGSAFLWVRRDRQAESIR